MTGFNIGCIDEIDTFNLKNITVIDGQNHILDKKNDEFAGSFII